MFYKIANKIKQLIIETIHCYNYSNMFSSLKLVKPGPVNGHFLNPTLVHRLILNIIYSIFGTALKKIFCVDQRSILTQVSINPQIQWPSG